MFRIILIFLLSFLVGWLTAQEAPFSGNEGSFEAAALHYVPPQRAGVSDEDFAYGKMVLRETVRQTEGNPADFNRADYFNILSAFLTLREPQPLLELAFEKFLTAPGSCEYLVEFWDNANSNPKYSPLLAAWRQAKARCEQYGAGTPAAITPEAYASNEGLDPALTLLFERLKERDQRFRKGGYQPARQTVLDRENERMIDSLFAVHGRYLGLDLVGERYASVMWSVIQHSRLETMERYLPVVHQAVKKKMLAPAPLRMLIDRIYTARTGQQVYGSQQGVALLPPAERDRIERTYGVE